MLTPLILFLGLTVATAVIAHWSDNLGKKLGKKRVSLFGLRPRTTATVLTIASSWCIMLFTLAALLLTVKPLRVALFSYDRERAQADSDRLIARNEIQAARGLLGQTRAQFGAAKGQLDATQTRLVTANASVTQSQRAAQDAKNQARSAEAARRQTDVAVRQAKTRLRQAQTRLDAAQTRLNAARNSEMAALGREKTAQGDTRIAEREKQAAQRERQAAQSARQVAIIDLERVKKLARLAGKLSYSAEKSASTADQRRKATEGQIAKLKEEGVLLEVQNNELRAQRSELTNLANQTLLFVGNDAPIKVRQVFAASRIVANQPPEDIVAQLRTLLEQGRESFARSEDIAPTPNFAADANLQLFPVDATDASGKPVTLQGEQLMQFLASAMRRQTVAKLISVRLLAVRNYLAGEKDIGVQFEFVPIKPAFAAGNVLASVTIDGAQGDTRIFTSLFDLLEFGQREAKKRGVDPPTSLNNADFYAEDTKPKLFEALRRIEGTKSRVNVNLVTARALTTVEQLQVRFEIEAQPIS